MEDDVHCNPMLLSNLKNILKQVQDFSKYLVFLQCLKREGIKKRHWIQIFGLLNVKIEDAPIVVTSKIVGGIKKDEI